MEVSENKQRCEEYRFYILRYCFLFIFIYLVEAVGLNFPKLKISNWMGFTRDCSFCTLIYFDQTNGLEERNFRYIFNGIFVLGGVEGKKYINCDGGVHDRGDCEPKSTFSRCQVLF